ncbi:MAG: hypothetical protein M1391_03935 [Bacteroidetes bacterium]|nr:hypothetical protein [Bacteroidota bacterium]
MLSTKVLFHQVVNGHTIRLVNVKGSIYVNLFLPSGHFSSHMFPSVLPAYAFVSFLIKKFNKK